MEKNKLNVGCGLDYRDGWINLDFDKIVKPDIVWNLSSIYDGKKLPFPDNHFDIVAAYDVIEHFQDPLPLLQEFYRITKPNGIIDIKVPYGLMAYKNLDHKRFFFLESFNFNSLNFGFDPNDKRVKIVKLEIYHLPIKNPLKRIIYNMIIPRINKLIKRSTAFYDDTFLSSIVSQTNIHVQIKKI